MEKLFFGTLTGCFLAIITINTHGILSTQNKAIKSHNNNDSGKCFLDSQRYCQKQQITPVTDSATTTVTNAPLLTVPAGNSIVTLFPGNGNNRQVIGY